MTSLSRLEEICVSSKRCYGSLVAGVGAFLFGAIYGFDSIRRLDLQQWSHLTIPAGIGLVYIGALSLRPSGHEYSYNYSHFVRKPSRLDSALPLKPTESLKEADERYGIFLSPVKILTSDVRRVKVFSPSTEPGDPEEYLLSVEAEFNGEQFRAIMGPEHNEPKDVKGKEVYMLLKKAEQYNLVTYG